MRVRVSAEMSEKELIRSAKAGQRRAMEVLLSRYYDKLYAVALKYTRSVENAQDAVQEACIQCIRHIASFREEASFRTWATRITINSALILARKGKRLVPVGSVVEDKQDIRVRTPELDVAVAQQLRAVERQLKSGRAGDYELFVQRYVCGDAISTIGHQTGMTVAAIKTRIHRARHRLRAM